MNDREFEKLLYEQVCREGAMYRGIMIAFGCCGIACAVMAVAAPIMFGLEALGISVKLLLLILLLAGMWYGARHMARSDGEAADEMAYGMEHPECNIPEDYMDETKTARQSAIRTLHSIRSLIVAYSIIALLLWAVTALIAFLSQPGTPSYSPILLLASFLTFSLALALTILTISYIRVIPAARRYRVFLDRGMEEEK